MVSAVSTGERIGQTPVGWARAGAQFFWRVVLRILWPFRQLPFKIGVAYTVTAVCAVVVAELILAAVIGWGLFSADQIPSEFGSEVGWTTGLIAPALEHRPVNALSLTRGLDAAHSRLQTNLFHSPVGWMEGPGLIAAVVDNGGRVLAGSPGTPFRIGSSLAAQLSPEDAAQVSLAANTLTLHRVLGRRTEAGDLMGVAPITDAAGRQLGQLVVRSTGRLRPDEFARAVFAIVAGSVPVMLILGGVTGLAFGSVVARPLTRRLRALSAAADAWGGGDFSTALNDKAGDEIGALTRRLAAMAGELRRHIRAQQRLATLEERTRLARDLHDTVKQQAFAAAMQLGAARTVLAGDTGPAGVFVAQAERLTNKVQEDLMAIILELRPATGEGAADSDAAERDLPTRLREEVLDWAQASGIPADVRVGGALHTPEDVSQAFLRIAQEALANAARHSGASRVQVELQQHDDGSVSLAVTDNGQGFDPVFTARGMGLYSMRDRALSLPGGRFALETRPGMGVTVRAACAGAADPPGP